MWVKPHCGAEEKTSDLFFQLDLKPRNARRLSAVAEPAMRIEHWCSKPRRESGRWAPPLHGGGGGERHLLIRVELQKKG